MPTEIERFMELARERFKLAEEAETTQRVEGLDDLRFSAADQWPEDIRRQREKDGRPCLTIDRLGNFIHQVANEQRQNRSAIQVSPVDDVADQDTAEVIQGLTRHVEVSSGADMAWDTAFDQAVRTGFGYVRIIVEYAAPDSFDLDIKFKRIKNQFSVYFDPKCDELDYSDAQWAFITDEMSIKEYRHAYPDSIVAGFADSAIGDQAPGWLSKDSVRVAEYFHIEKKKRKLLKLADGSIIFADEVPPGVPIQIKNERDTEIPTVHWCKINGVEKLEETQWLGQWIPIVPVNGDEINVNGIRHLLSLIRNAKDSQRAYNYWASAETEAIALAPRAPWVVAEGQDEGHETEWREANVRNFACLHYKPVALNGQPVEAPHRNAVEPAIQAISQARMQAADDLKATMGLYDASLGARSNETSGRAIVARQREGDVATYHFTDNLTRARRHAARILIDLFPKVWDKPMVRRILGEGDVPRTITLNQPFVENGQEKIYDLTTGKYDVTVSVGPSFATKRQEAAASMMDFVKAYPLAAQFIGDLLVKNLDWPGATEIARRLKKMLPPELQEPEDGKQPPIPPQIQAQMTALMQQHDMLVKALDAATETLNTKRLELESKERIAAIQAQVALITTEAKLGSAEAVELLRAEIAAIGKRLDLLHENQPVGEGESAGGAVQ